MHQQILAALHNTLVSDVAVIKQASALIDTLKVQQGYCVALMEIVDNQTLSPDLRQAAVAQLQNNVRSRWAVTPTSKLPAIPQTDKNVIRQHIMTALIRCNRDLKYLPVYKNIVKLIMDEDRETWLPTTECLAALKGAVDSNNSDPNIIPSVLHFIMAMVKSFEKEVGATQKHLEVLVQRLFPALLQIIKNYPTLENIFLIVKIYWKSIIMDLGTVRKQFSVYWIPIIKEIIDKSLPEYANVNVENLKKSDPAFFYFHTKKWATRIIMKFVQRHANPSNFKENAEYSKEFYRLLGEGLAQSLINQIKMPLIAKAKYFNFKSLVYMVQEKPQLFENSAVQLMVELLPPFLKLTPEDEQLSKEDPVEFLRKEEDPVQNFTNVKMAATDLWMGLCSMGTETKKKKRQMSKMTVLGMEFVNAQLASSNPLEKEMAMYLICKLRNSLMEIKSVRDSLPHLIDKYVISEFNNPEMFLRARAVELFSDYGYIEFKDTSVLKRAVEGIYVCLMKDQHTIVKVKAACSFNCILKHKEAVEWVKPYLNDILTVYIKLLDKYDLQNLVLSLEGIISRFSNQIGPYAVRLVQHLCAIFLKYVKIDLQKACENDYDGEVQMAASGCLQAISGIIDSPLPKQVYPLIEPLILPLLSYAFTDEGVDYIGDVLSFLSSFIYKSDTLSPNMWFFYPVIIYNLIGLDSSIDTSAVPVMNENQHEIFNYLRGSGNLEHLEASVSCIRNFIYKGKDVISTQNDFFGNNLIMMLFKLADAAYKISDDPQFESDEEKASVSALMVYILENFSQKEPLIPYIWQLVKFNFDKVKSSYLKCYNMQLVCMCIYATPALTIGLLTNEGYYEKLLQGMADAESKFEDEWQKQRIVLGLSTLLRNYTVSEQVRASLPTLLKLLVKQIGTIYDIRKLALEDIEDLLNKDSEEEEEEAQDEDEGDDFDEDIWSEGHADNYETDLDNIDEVGFFEESLKQVQSADTPLYTQLITQFKPEELTDLNMWIEKSKEQFRQRQEEIKAETSQA